MFWPLIICWSSSGEFKIQNNINQTARYRPKINTIIIKNIFKEINWHITAQFLPVQKFVEPDERDYTCNHQTVTACLEPALLLIYIPQCGGDVRGIPTPMLHAFTASSVSHWLAVHEWWGHAQPIPTHVYYICVNFWMILLCCPINIFFSPEDDHKLLVVEALCSIYCTHNGVYAEFWTL